MTIQEFVDEKVFFSRCIYQGVECMPVKHTSPITLSADIRYRIENWESVDFSLKDYLTPIERGKEWLLELTVQFQPKTGKLLHDSGPLWIRELPNQPPMLHMGLTVGNSVVLMYRRLRGLNAGDENLDETAQAGARQYSLPDPIRSAYYERYDGLNMPGRVYPGPSTQLLPFPIGRPWVSWDVYLEKFRGYKGKYLDWLKERIPNVAPKRKSDRWTNFMMFLDTRPLGDKGKEGDVLFVKNHIQDGVIYHIKDADIENMRILEFSAEAIDSYCEHILLQKSGRFDFMPFTREM